MADLRIGPSSAYISLFAEDNALPANPGGPAEGIDDILSNLAANCLANNGTANLNTPGTNAAPTGGGANADYVALTGSGWIVSIN